MKLGEITVFFAVIDTLTFQYQHPGQSLIESI